MIQPNKVKNVPGGSGDDVGIGAGSLQLSDLRNV